jgi:hypothetical protein
MHCLLFKFTLTLNSVLYWELFVFDTLLSTTETFPRSISALKENLSFCQIGLNW